jgi:preprotein translocase subunit Sss1
MKHLTLRIWFLATLIPIFVAIIIRIIWELAVNPSTSSLVMSILVILGLVGLYAFISYFTLKPDWKKLTSLPVLSAIVVMATGGVIGGIIHLARFIPSPEVGLPWSLVIAVLCLAAGTSAYIMLLWILWATWKSRKNQE